MLKTPDRATVRVVVARSINATITPVLTPTPSVAAKSE
jgi:hypothetical protein